MHLIWVLDDEWECDSIGRGDTFMLCVNAEACGRKRVQGIGSGKGTESIMGCEARKVKGSNYMESSKYYAKKLMLLAIKTYF